MRLNYSSLRGWSPLLVLLLALAPLAAACGDADSGDDGDVNVEDVLVIGDLGFDADTGSGDLGFDGNPEDVAEDQTQQDADAGREDTTDAGDEPDASEPDADAYDEPDARTPDADAYDEPDARTPDADVYDEPDAAPPVCECARTEICAAETCVCRPGYARDREGVCVRERCRRALVFSDCDECADDINKALDALNIGVGTYTNNSAEFVSAYEGGGFDLLVYFRSNAEATREEESVIADWFGGNGLLLFSYWNLDESALQATFGVLAEEITVPPDLYPAPTSGIDLFDLFAVQDSEIVKAVNDLDDNGDLLYFAEGTEGLVLLGNNPLRAQPLAVITNRGSTILNGFNEADFVGTDTDDDGVADPVVLYANELQLLCGPTALVYGDSPGRGSPAEALESLEVVYFDTRPGEPIDGGIGDPVLTSESLLTNVLIDLFVVDAGGNDAIAFADLMVGWIRSGGRLLVDTWRLDDERFSGLWSLFGVEIGAPSTSWSPLESVGRGFDLFDFVHEVTTPVVCTGGFGDNQYPLTAADPELVLAGFPGVREVAAVVQRANQRQILSGPLWGDCAGDDADTDELSDALEIWVNQIVWVFLH